jgi:hypothetical protein
VVTEPISEDPVPDGVCSAAVVSVQLKQYSVPGVKSLLGNVTSWPLAAVAVLIPGQAVAQGSTYRESGGKRNFYLGLGGGG